ncbi:S8 family serine peptidase [Rubritalea tangerina]|uniref:S8 family serine peptidase n=1 Tax=Rubritalea tangerina TaxID=430798 RepID=A0ABW4ZDW3_9BACT
MRSLTLACIGLLGYVFYASFQKPNSRHQSPPPNKLAPSSSTLTTPRNPSLTASSPALSSAQPSPTSDALENEREALLHFKDKASYQNFLNQATNRGLRIIGSSDRLRTLRVGFTDFSQLNNIDNADVAPNFPVFIPSPPEVSAQDGALGFGANALAAIGITEDNSAWGSGVTVAVIDSGVQEHIALTEGVTRLVLTDTASSDSSQLGHGTAVASIISGNHPLTQGVAPSADILSIQITDAQGSSNSFTLAEGILAAVDGGAQIINISMGSEGNSSVVAEAIAYAQDRGIVIVASSGNEGYSTPAYPAAYDGVISVGAIEANGEHLDFSNTGENLSLVAPGYEVNAAWGEDLLTSFSGTSASAPFVSGAIAAVMSENPGYTAQQATDLILSLSNEAGLPGADPQYGQGSLDLGRALENGTPGVYDIAVASHVLGQNSAGVPEVTVVIQNQGTESLFNSPVTIQTPQGPTTISINSLIPGQIYTTTLPLPSLNSENSATISTSVTISQQQDVDPRNDTKQSTFSPSAE